MDGGDCKTEVKLSEHYPADFGVEFALRSAATGTSMHAQSSVGRRTEGEKYESLRPTLTMPVVRGLPLRTKKRRWASALAEAEKWDATWADTALSVL